MGLAEVARAVRRRAVADVPSGQRHGQTWSRVASRCKQCSTLCSMNLWFCCVQNHLCTACRIMPSPHHGAAAGDMASGGGCARDAAHGMRSTHLGEELAGTPASPPAPQLETWGSSKKMWVCTTAPARVVCVTAWPATECRAAAEDAQKLRRRILRCGAAATRCGSAPQRQPEQDCCNVLNCMVGFLTKALITD